MAALASIMLSDPHFTNNCNISKKKLFKIQKLIEYTGTTRTIGSRKKKQNNVVCKYRRIEPWHVFTSCLDSPQDNKLLCLKHTILEALWCNMYHLIKNPLVAIYQRILMSESLFGFMDLDHTNYVLNMSFHVPQQKIIEFIGGNDCLPYAVDNSPSLSALIWKQILMGVLNRDNLTTKRTILIRKELSAQLSIVYSAHVLMADIIWYLDCRLIHETQMTNLCYFGALCGGGGG